MSETPWIIADSGTQQQICKRCGHKQPLPTGPIDYCIDVMMAFIVQHKDCKEKS